jgi:hypothetical protein
MSTRGDLLGAITHDHDGGAKSDGNNTAIAKAPPFLLLGLGHGGTATAKQQKVSDLGKAPDENVTLKII